MIIYNHFFGVDNIQIIHFDAEADFVIVGT